MTAIDHPVLRLPARDIPIPTSVSPEAQAMLALGHLGPPLPSEFPAPDDVAGWHAYVDQQQAFVDQMIGDPVAGFAGTVDEVDLGTCPMYVVTPEGVDPADRRVLFDVHGGGFVLGSGAMCKMTGIVSANAVAAQTWAVDYRMPPDHPMPAPLDDCIGAYRRLLEHRDPTEIVVCGTSAGGCLAAAMILRCGKEGLPVPAAVVFNTGAFDLTASSDSLRTNDGLDSVLGGSMTPVIDLFRGPLELRDPAVSPLFGDLSDFPPTMLLTGTRDMLLSDNVRMHRALRGAGVDAELHVWEAAGHGGFMGTAPEDTDRYCEIRRFSELHWGRAAAGRAR